MRRIAVPDGDEAEEVGRDYEEVVENEEEEDKPLAQPTSMTSEETHGGRESTESIEGSPSPSKNSSSEDSERGGEEVGEARDGSGEGAGYLYEESSGDAEEGGEGEGEIGADNDGNDLAGSDDSHSNDGPGIPNSKQVVDLWGYYSYTRYIQTEFYRFIERFAEERTRIYDRSGYEVFDLRRIMLRRYERKPLSSYMVSRVRDRVAMILDNSGSMEWWAVNLAMLARLALSRDDIEVYIAPNGVIEEVVVRGRRIPVRHDNAIKALRGRRIIYVGDFDGANTAVMLSRDNDVIWVCPEKRYRRFRSHSWVSHDEDDFRGVFIRAWDIDEMFNGFRRVTRFHRLWIDLHEGEVYSDDMAV